jgi:hypothetical protein
MHDFLSLGEEVKTRSRSIAHGALDLCPFWVFEVVRDLQRVPKPITYTFGNISFSTLY